VRRNEFSVEDAKRLPEVMRIPYRSLNFLDQLVLEDDCMMAVKVAGIEAGRIVELFTATPVGPAEKVSDYLVSSLYITAYPWYVQDACVLHQSSHCRCLANVEEDTNLMVVNEANWKEIMSLDQYSLSVISSYSQ
jgi:hypothetical protein